MPRASVCPDGHTLYADTPDSCGGCFPLHPLKSVGRVKPTYLYITYELNTKLANN